MFIRGIVERVRGRKRREKVKVEIEELKKALLEDPRFRDEVLKELEYRTGRRDFLKISVLGLLGALGIAESVSSTSSPATPATTPTVSSNTAREIVSDYSGVKIPKPCTCIVAQDGTGDYDISPGEDASEVIQKAIDYAHNKGGVVEIREGKYIVKSAHLTIPSNVYLKGVGEVTFSIRWGGYYGRVGYALITNENYAGNGNKNIRIENIRFISDPSNWPEWEKGSRLFVFKNVNNVEIVGCYFSHHGSGGELHIWNSKDILISNTKAIHNLARGLNVGDAVFKVTGKNILIENCEATPSSIRGSLAFNVAGQKIIVRDCYGHDATSGCWVEHDDTSWVKVYGCHFENLRNEGIGVSGVRIPIKYVIIEDNTIEKSILNGILIGGSSDVIARSNIIEGCNGSGIAIRASSNVIIDSNIIRSCSCGVFLGGKDCSVSGNQILNCNEGIRICKARYYFLMEDGLYNQITNNLIADKRSKPLMTYAIYENKLCNCNVISENYVLTGKIVKSGKNITAK